ncbi:MAG: Gfo/Idh/MocA family oxidoreductase, partial [Verrucomicrobiota bacterium]
AKLAAVCSLAPEERQRAAGQLGNPALFESYEAMIEKGELDAVAIVSPSGFHVDHMILALEAGLHIFCEKPLGLDLESCRRAEAAHARHPDQQVMLGFMRRFDPTYREARKRLRSGDVGRPILFRSYSIDPESAIDGAIRFAPTSGGQFLDMAIHDIDLARWYLQAEPVSVFAAGDCYAHPEFAEHGDGDNLAAFMQFDNGSLAFFLAGRTAPNGYQVESEIIGTRQTLRIATTPQRNHLEILDPHGVRRVCSQNFLERFAEAFLTEMQAFIDGIRERKPPEITLADGTAATRIALAATESFRRNELVRLS